MGIAHNLKRTFMAFSLQIACLLFAYLAYVLWNGISITGSMLSDTLLLGFLPLVFVLNYAIISRHSAEEIGQDKTVQDSLPLLGTKREQALKYLKVLGHLSSGQLASLLEIDVRNLSKFLNPLIQTGVLAARKEGKTFIYSIRDAHTTCIRIIVILQREKPTMAFMLSCRNGRSSYRKRATCLAELL